MAVILNKYCKSQKCNFIFIVCVCVFQIEVVKMLA